VEPSALSKPIGPSRVIASVAAWTYQPGRNGVASGWLSIEADGEYAFRSDGFYDRTALYIDGALVCPYRDFESNIARISLKKGLVLIESVGMADSRGEVKVDWMPPGEREMQPIPTNLLVHD